MFTNPDFVADFGPHFVPDAAEKLTKCGGAKVVVGFNMF